MVGRSERRDRAGLQRVFDGFPGGAHVAEARQRIQAIDEKTWAEAAAAGTIVAFNKYRAVSRWRPRRAGSKEHRRVGGGSEGHTSFRRKLANHHCLHGCAGSPTDGILHGERGTEGKPNSMTLDGKIELDGSAELYARGLTNESIYTIGAGSETIYAVYIVNPRSHELSRAISLRQLILSDPACLVADIGSPRKPVTATPMTDRQDVARVISQYNLLAVPVVDPSDV
jgi:hypothetical protein